MGDDDLAMGPIDYLIVEWPAGSKPTGEGLPILEDLVDRGIIRILDLAFLQKEEDGSVLAVDIGDFDLDGNPDLAVWVGASSGVLGEDDFSEAGAALEPGTTAALLLYENSWAAPFAAALRRSGAQLVAQGRVPINALVAALDELEAAEA
jgi:hypothetical protein